jgi:hypothetical protein
MKTKKTASAAPQTAPHDSLAVNRQLPVVAAASIPPAPAGFVPTPPEERVRRLTRPADSLRAELRAALALVISRKATYRQELGDVPPDVAVAETLHPRLAELQTSREAAERLVTYLRELEAIALSDAANYLQTIDEEVTHRARKNSALTSIYAPVLLLAQSRSQAIAEGMARSRRDQENAAGDEPSPTP